MEGYKRSLAQVAPKAAGVSKISIQTGTSHGGVVLPDGTIAQVKVDFDTLSRLSRLARKDYGLGGAVQHGASTLPEEAFTRFAEAGACEVHLATNFQNMLYDRLPDNLRRQHVRLPGPELRQGAQARPERRAVLLQDAQAGARAVQGRPVEHAHRGSVHDRGAWEEQFRLLFGRLEIARRRAQHVKHIRQAGQGRCPPLSGLRGGGRGLGEDVSDLAD